MSVNCRNSAFILITVFLYMFCSFLNFHYCCLVSNSGSHMPWKSHTALLTNHNKSPIVGHNIPYSVSFLSSITSAFSLLLDTLI